jgi:hypothetical protein
MGKPSFHFYASELVRYAIGTQHLERFDKHAEVTSRAASATPRAAAAALCAFQHHDTTHIMFDL